MPLIILFKPFMGLSGPTSAVLSLQGGTLPTAFSNVVYSHDISALANGGRLPYTFSTVSQSGPNNYTVSGVGVVLGAPTTVNVRIANTGDYRGDNNGNLRIST